MNLNYQINKFSFRPLSLDSYLVDIEIHFGFYELTKESLYNSIYEYYIQITFSLKNPRLSRIANRYNGVINIYNLLYSSLNNQEWP